MSGNGGNRSGVTAADWQKQKQQQDAKLRKKLAGQDKDLVSINPADTVYLFTDENDWPFGIPHVTCFRDAKVDVPAYFGLKANLSRATEHVITGYSAASKLDQVKASDLLALEEEELAKSSLSALGAGATGGTKALLKKGTSPDLIQSRWTAEQEQEEEEGPSVTLASFAMPHTTPSAKAAARKAREEQRIKERERMIPRPGQILDPDAEQPAGADFLQASAEDLLGGAGGKKKQGGKMLRTQATSVGGITDGLKKKRKPKEEKTLAQRQKIGLMKLNMKSMAQKGTEMGELAMHAKQFAREVMQFALKAETMRDEGRMKGGSSSVSASTGADFFSMESQADLKETVDDKVTREQDPGENNPLGATASGPLERAFWESYRLSNSHADYRMIEENNARARTFGDFKSERILGDSNIRGMEFSRRDPRWTRIETITSVAQKDAAGGSGRAGDSRVSEAIFAAAQAQESRGSFFAGAQAAAAAASRKHWREEDQVAAKKLSRSKTVGADGLFGDLELAGAEFPRGFATCTLHCDKQKHPDLAAIAADLDEYNVLETMRRNEAGKAGGGKEEVQVYRGGARKSLFKSRVRAEQFTVPDPKKEKSVEKFLDETSLTDGMAAKVAAHVRLHEMTQEEKVAKLMEGLKSALSEEVEQANKSTGAPKGASGAATSPDDSESPKNKPSLEALLQESEEFQALEKERIALMPAPAERTRAIAPSDDGCTSPGGGPQNLLDQAQAALEDEARNNMEAEKMMLQQEAAAEPQIQMSEAMRKKMEAKFAEATADPELLEKIAAEEAAEEAARQRAKELLEMNSHRKFFPHYEELKRSDRIRSVLRQKQSLASRMARGDKKLARAIQFSFGRNMPCFLPPAEEQAIGYLERKVRQSKREEVRENAHQYKQDEELYDGDDLRGFGDGFLGSNFDPTPATLQEVYPNPNDESKKSPRTKMFQNDESFRLELSFDPLRYDPKKPSKNPPAASPLDREVDKNTGQPKKSVSNGSNTSSASSNLPPIFKVMKSGLAKMHEQTDRELAQRVGAETKQHWGTHERQDNIEKQKKVLAREKLIEKCNTILAAIAPELTRSEEGQRIAQMRNNPGNSIPPLDKFLAAAATGYLDVHTLRTMPGNYWSANNHHPDMIGFMHQRKSMTLDDVTKHLAEYIKERAAIEHREAVLLYGKRNVVLNTQKKIMDLLLGLGNKNSITNLLKGNKNKKVATTDTTPSPETTSFSGMGSAVADENGVGELYEKMIQDTLEYDRTRVVNGIGSYNIDKAARLKRHFDTSLGQPRSEGGPKEFRENVHKSRVAVLASLSDQAQKRPLYLPPAKTFRGVGSRVDETTKSKMNPRGTSLYAEVCQVSELIPRLHQIHHPDEGKFDISDSFTTDSELFAMSFLLTKRSLKTIDLSGNTELSDDSMVTIVERILEEGPSLQTLRAFSAANCTGIGDTGLQAFIDLIPSLKSLRELNISGIRAMAPSTLLRLSEVLGERPMHKIGLADIELPVTLATRVLQQVLSNNYLVELDVGWNSFSEEVFLALREILTDHKTLECLRLPNCAEVVPKPDHNPIHVFLEGFCDYRLKYVDLSTNRCTMKSCCVLEAALYQNDTARTIDMNNNAIGAEGCRSLFRAFACHSTLQFLHVSLMHAAVIYENPDSLQKAALALKQAEEQAAAMKAASGVQPEKEPWELPERLVIEPSSSAKIGVQYSLYCFLQSNPQRQYTINLYDPGQRAILKLLLRVRDRVQGTGFVGLDEGFFSTVLNQGANGRWDINLPEPGSPEAKKFNPEISFRFVYDVGTMEAARQVAGSGSPTLKKMPGGIPEEKPVDPVVKMLDALSKAAKTVFPRDREIRLGNIWLDLQTSAADQQVFLDALSFDFEITHELIAFLIARTPHLRHQILCQLFGALRGGRAAQRILFLFNAPTDTDMSKVYLHAMALMNFVPENPSGHYKLSLDSLADWSVGVMLMRIDAWEMNLVNNERDCKFGKPKFVVSQHGNPSNFRNEQLNGHYFEMGPSFQLPMSCPLVCDYSSPRRPPLNATPMVGPDGKWASDLQVGQLMKTLIMSLKVIFLGALRAPPLV
eukprot:g16650.t1